MEIKVYPALRRKLWDGNTVVDITVDGDETTAEINQAGKCVHVNRATVAGQKPIVFDMSEAKAQVGAQISPPTSRPCICDYPDGSATVAQREAVEGHYNQAGGFCCPHHGNTCGYCHQHDG